MALADDVLCLRRSTRKWLHQRASALRDGRGHVDIVVRITAPQAEEEFWSWLERTCDRTVVPRVRPPAYNVPVHDRRGRIGIADALEAAGKPARSGSAVSR